MMYSVFVVGVPLFMMLTGYLNIHKTPTVKYYKGMLRVLVAYQFFSIVTIAFRKYYLGEELSLVQWVLKVFDYSAIPYAWYIEMWIGLALLTPFLNYLYRAIPTMMQKLLLLATLFVMSSVPDLCNRYGMYLMPGYFAQACYPLMFYFMGAFIREYQPTIKSWVGHYTCHGSGDTCRERGGLQRESRYGAVRRWSWWSVLHLDCRSHLPHALSS